MARITVEDCLEHVANRFLLVHLANKRSKQILRGAPIKIKGALAKENKAIVTSLREIAEGEIRFMTPAEQTAHAEERAREQAEAAKAVAASSPAPSAGVSALEELFGNSSAAPAAAAPAAAVPDAEGKNGHHA